MATKTYHGSCHCGKVKFTADIDLSKGTGRCNCTLCTKTRNWGVTIKPEAFHLISGKDDITDYTKSKPLTFAPGEKMETYATHHMFCKHCGVRSFGAGNIPEIGGDYYSVSIACLDDIDFKEAMESPIQFFNGRDNNWFQTPSYTKHM